jgi:hypothetical protein
MIDLGHWDTKVIIEEGNIPYGFIYKITCLTNNKKYIGKKQCQSILKRKPLKGKKNKRCEVIETNWREYTSSSRELNEDILKYGKENFKFEILELCDSKFALAYREAKIQFEEEVLLRDDYYNGIINLRVSKPKNYIYK